MTDTTADALASAPAFVADLFGRRLPGGHVFHTFERAERVVRFCVEIGRESGLRKGDLDIVALAAWFAETGRVEAGPDHRVQSALIAESFLLERGVPREIITCVQECIQATGRRRPPANRLEEVLCDADAAFLGKKKTLRSLALLRTEREHLAGKPLGDAEWLAWAVELVTGTTYHTAYARATFDQRRVETLVTLQSELRDALAGEEGRKARAEAKRELLETKVEREKRPERGIETMFRTAPRNHLDLSSIADHKANILISVNALVISIVVARIIGGMDEIQFLLVPILILLAVCVLTIVFATLATKPKLTTGTFTRDDIRQKKANLLFFGNFYRMPYEDFEWGMSQMMSDRDYLYGSMIRDFFHLGQVLGRKYFYLRIAYTVFMYGIVVAVIAFAVALSL